MSPAQAATYDFAASFSDTDLQCGYFVNTVTCAAAAVVGSLDGVKTGDVFNLSATFKNRIFVGGSRTSNVAFIAMADATLVLGQGPGAGYVSRYRTQLQNFQGPLPPFGPGGGFVTSHGSGYFGFGGYAGGYGVPNTGFSFTGINGQLTALSDAPRRVGGLVVGYSYVIPNSPQVVAGVQGGSAQSPVILPSGQVGKVTASIGGTFGADQFYGFSWRGGLFQTTGEVLNSDPTAVYSLRLLDVNRDLIEGMILDASNGFKATLRRGLLAGDYVIGIRRLSGGGSAMSANLDQFSVAAENEVSQFALNFDTPVGNVPEPGSWAMMILGFGLAGSAMRRPRRTTVLG